MTAWRTTNTRNQNWGTPQKYVDAVKDVFRGEIDLDPCSNEHSIVGASIEYQLPDHDGLATTWNFRRIFVNPPYGADREKGTSIKDWLRRCVSANLDHGAEVIALVPVATNTAHWKDYVFGCARTICFLYDTRLKFLVEGKDGGKGAPMSCAMIYWGEDYDRFFEVFLKHGAVVDLRNLRVKEIHSGRRIKKLK